MRFGTLVKMADQVLKYKYIVKNVCYRNGYTATFMPKPLFGDNGSGMHTHQSLWNGEHSRCSTTRTATRCCQRDVPPLHRRPAQARAGASWPSPRRRPTSYRRLVPGYEAPINLVYSQRNRSACVRIPTYSQQPEGAPPGVPRSRPVVQPVPRLLGAC